MDPLCTEEVDLLCLCYDYSREPPVKKSYLSSATGRLTMRENLKVIADPDAPYRYRALLLNDSLMWDKSLQGTPFWDAEYENLVKLQDISNTARTQLRIWIWYLTQLS